VGRDSTDLVLCKILLMYRPIEFVVYHISPDLVMKHRVFETVFLAVHSAVILTHLLFQSRIHNKSDIVRDVLKYKNSFKDGAYHFETLE